jgi:RND family efflux transporter MFP subunit
MLVLALFAAALLVLRPWAATGADAARESGGPVPVRGALVARGDLSVFASYPGELVGEAIELAPKVSGRLQAVRARVGDRVAAGDEMAVIDDADLRRELAEARAGLAVAEANSRRAAAQLQESATELERAASLSAEQLISAQDHERVQARAARSRAELQAAEAEIEQARARSQILARQVGETQVVAPFAGTVAVRYLDPGALVQAGTAILRLVQVEPLLVQFRIPERDLGRIAEGSPFTLTTQATGKQAFAGQVRRLSGEVSRQDRTVLVEGRVLDNPGVLRPGMYAEARVELERVADALLLPGAAVSRRVLPGGREETGVFTVGADSVARWRAVEVLAAQGNQVAVAGDLQAADTVLTLGHEELADGSLVQVMRGAGPDGEAEAPHETP